MNKPVDIFVPNLIAADEISRTVYLTNTEQYALDRADVETWQLRAAQSRFEQLMPTVAALHDQAEQNKVTRVDQLDDIVPLLFNHTVYKSYPISLIEKNRYDMLTKWLQRSTSIDISGVDVSQCGGLDEWMETLERETPLQVYHTSGTSGKLSFFARTTLERDLWNDGWVKMFEGIGDEPSIVLAQPDSPRLPVIYPSARFGRYMAQRLVKYLAEKVSPTPDQCYTMNNGTLSADLMTLSGRIRIAQAKGELSKMKLSDAQKIAMKRYLDETEKRPAEMAAFFNVMMDKLKGKRVFIFSQSSYLTQAAKEGIARGVRGVFAPDSWANYGGGGKGVVLPDNWQELIHEFSGISAFKQGYGMTEITGSMGMCPKGHYHFQKFVIPFLLTPDGSKALPREGRQTGRFGALDLAAQHLWGGLITGDKLTIEWDVPCGCGRKGAYVAGPISRYDESVTGDDKISCAATVDNTDAALQTLLAV